ncbi:MAG: LamG domain-containing protein, partial [Planctomycetes bacterium]|nr:LamG domain-containing protein [Planctomycetota bacterium]
GKIGGALEFSEPTSYAVTSSPVFKDQVTASFWLRVKYEEGNNPRLIEPWCALQYEHRKGVGQGSQTADAAKPEPGAWWHFAVAIDFIERTITIYRNGDQVARGPLVIARHTGTLVFGHNRDPGNPRDTFRGQLDDIRIYGRILTPEEIAQLAGAD